MLNIKEVEKKLNEMRKCETDDRPGFSIRWLNATNDLLKLLEKNGISKGTRDSSVVLPHIKPPSMSGPPVPLPPPPLPLQSSLSSNSKFKPIQLRTVATDKLSVLDKAFEIQALVSLVDLYTDHRSIVAEAIKTANASSTTKYYTPIPPSSLGFLGNDDVERAYKYFLFLTRGDMLLPENPFLTGATKIKQKKYIDFLNDFSLIQYQNGETVWKTNINTPGGMAAFSRKKNIKLTDIVLEMNRLIESINLKKLDKNKLKHLYALYDQYKNYFDANTEGYIFHNPFRQVKRKMLEKHVLTSAKRSATGEDIAWNEDDYPVTA